MLFARLIAMAWDSMSWTIATFHFISKPMMFFVTGVRVLDDIARTRSSWNDGLRYVTKMFRSVLSAIRVYDRRLFRFAINVSANREKSVGGHH